MIKTYRIEIAAFLSSVLLSLWLIYSDPVINTDGVLYLQSAEAIAQGDWRQAVEIYPWPFYSALIAAVHAVTHVDFDIAAYILNSLLCGTLAFAFVALVREFGANNRTLWFALIFILALPSLNGYRSYVIRDFGFWAFYLLGLWSFFRFQQIPGMRHALCWSAAMGTATLFRIEGAAFLTILPAIVFWRPKVEWRTALREFAQLHIVLLIGAVTAALWLGTQGESAFSGRLLEPVSWLQRFATQLSEGLDGRAEVLRNGLLKTYAESFAMPGVLSIMLVMFVMGTVKSTSLLGIAASIYAWIARAVPLPGTIKRSFIAALVINAVVLVVFITSQFFVSQRYVLSMALTFALLAPFGLNLLHDRWQTRGTSASRMSWVYPIALLILTAMAVDSLWSTSASKQYIKDAGLWLRDNTPSDARILSRNAALRFYAHKSNSDGRISEEPDDEFYSAENFARHDYVVVLVRGKEGIPPVFSSAAPMREFRNKADDRALLFKAADLSNR